MRESIVNDIIAYENAEMTEEQAIAFFQELVDTGFINAMQGHYQRTAAVLIEAGLVVA